MNCRKATAFFSVLLGALTAIAAPPAAQPTATRPPATDKNAVSITFEKYDIGKPVESVTEKGVVFKLAWAPQDTTAKGRVMFFPHLKTDKKGILNAMAVEQGIPIRADFPASGASSVTLALWATVACPALIEAYDKDGKFLTKASRDAAPVRTNPADPIPTFELTVTAPEGKSIAYILFGGARNGEALVADEVRFSPAAAASQTQPATAPGS